MAYFEQKHPSDCDEKSSAAISGRFFKELLMKNGFYVYQVEEKLLLSFLAPFACMHNNAGNTLDMKESDTIVLSRVGLF